ncbi:S8 family serine peptidase [Kiloniella sp. EL199]|uniref:S8 family serine peptidase n=1 Tax=Kiloniella sp. EL199 TaxID=2107581 RepID=UPI000EA15C7F|nr:S8 family serine peptidase [Kiloniella sp. EL199]
MADSYHWQDDGIKAVDPYEDWLLDTGAGYGFPFGPPNEAHCYTGTEASDNFVAGDENPDAIYPVLYRPGGEQPSFRPFVLRESSVSRGISSGDAFPHSNAGTSGIKRRIGVPLRAASVNQSYVSEALVTSPCISSSAKVVVGVIDDGIAIANRHFQSEAGSTRIDFAWVQDGDTQSGSGAGSVSCSGTGSNVAFGREYTKADIDGALAEHTDALGATDEAALYRALGLVDSRKVMPNSLDGKAAHGTHVLDLAAGGDYESTSSDVLEEDRIIAVQVPAAVTWDTSGMGLDSFILAGVHYILDRADRVAPNLPVVINFSYGIFGGPHDGTSLLEKAIDEIVTARNDRVAPTSVVLPSGNHHLQRSHAVIADADFNVDGASESSGAADCSCDLPWRVQPNDRTSSYLEIWMPESDYEDGDIEVEVIPPNTDNIPAQRLSGVVNSAVVLNRGTRAVARLSYDRHVPLSKGDERGRFMLVLAPTEIRTDTAEHLNPLKSAPNGLWTVRIIKRPGKKISEPVHARIQRDASPFGYPALGRQSYFDDMAYQLYDHEGKLQVEDNHSIVKRAGSSNGLATGTVPIVVASHVEATGRATVYSGYQTTDSGLPEHAKTPFVSAESDRSNVFRGVPASGVNSGVSVTLDGTSVAAPTITRVVANAYKAGVATSPLDELQAQAIAIEATRQAKEYFAPLDANRQGIGRFPKDEIYGS